MQALHDAFAHKTTQGQARARAAKDQLPIWSAPGGFEFHFELQAHEHAPGMRKPAAKMHVEFGVEMRMGEHNLVEEPPRRVSVR